ncbi:MAG: glycosyltransferase family A protein [Acidilobus sp.]
MTAQPYISVIVTAYNRRRYLPFALRSLEAQTLPRDRFEVIVVKNFDDKESDDIISRNGWKEVYNDDLYQGRMVLAGLEESRGEVITFLDDDDMYVNNRLEEVYKAFTSFKRLVYFHNSQTIIDGNGNVLERPPPSLLISKNLVGGSPIVVDVDRLRGLAKRYNVSVADLVLKVRAGADFNSSSLAVRRPVLEPHVQLLKRLPISIDSFVFVSSVKARGLMYFTDERLTLYRVHGASFSANFSMQLGNSRAAELRAALGYLKFAVAYRLLSEVLGDDCNYYGLHSLSTRAGLQMLLRLGPLPPCLRVSLRDLARALRCYLRGPWSLAESGLLPALVFYALYPLFSSPLGGALYRLGESVYKRVYYSEYTKTRPSW